MIVSHQFSLIGTTFEFTGENKNVFKSLIVAKSWKGLFSEIGGINTPEEMVETP